MRYRVRSEDYWSAGIVDNLSASGILLHTERELLVGTQLVIEIRLLADRPTRLITRGSVIRMKYSPGARHPWAVAAKLELQEYKCG